MVEFSAMVSRPLLIAIALVPVVSACLWPGAAEALCTDPPGPGVNWQRCNFDRQDLAAVDLSGARLRDTSFIRADLSGSKMVKADSTRAKFVNATLNGTVFDDAKLYEADLTKADLTEASLNGADLRLARMFRATLRGADLTGARLRGTDLSQADLSGATWTDGERICAEGSVGRCN